MDEKKRKEKKIRNIYTQNKTENFIIETE